MTFTHETFWNGEAFGTDLLGDELWAGFMAWPPPIWIVPPHLMLNAHKIV
jgi:hypothetical protein